MKNSVTEILFEDNHLLIVNKASGDTVIPTRSGSREDALVGRLEKKYGKLFVIHRIDKATSGLVCFAKTEEAHRAMSMMFENRQVDKAYLAVVKGKLQSQNGSIDYPLAENPAKPGTMKVYAKGKEAYTEYELAEQFKHAALVRFKILTGRMHQIRVHAATIGHPLLVDEIYSGSSSFSIAKYINKYKSSAEEERPTIARLTLHASSITFMHPITGDNLTVTAPLPKDIEVLLKLLRKHDA